MFYGTDIGFNRFDSGKALGLIYVIVVMPLGLTDVILVMT